MSPAALDVARRLAAHPRLGWRAGMRATRPDGTFPLRVVAVVGGFTAAHEEHAVGDAVGACRGVWRSDVPDLDDPATAGVVLDMLTTTGVTSVGPHYSLAAAPHRRWYVAVDTGRHGRGIDTYYGATLGEAAGRALLAVWGEP